MNVLLCSRAGLSDIGWRRQYPYVMLSDNNDIGERVSDKKSHIEPTQDINLKVGSVRMTLSIPRDEATEHALRKGAERVNTTLERYRNAFPRASQVEILSYVALDIASQLQRQEVQSTELELERRLMKLNRDLEQIF